MNETVRRTLAAPLVLLFALLLGGCQSDPGAPPLEGASIGGPFTLTSHQGRRVSDSEFAGRYRLVYFGYAFCPDVCPVDLQVLGAGLRAFEQENPERAARVQPIFITVDPARDTPQVLRDYVANFHPRLIGLTGSEEEIASTARSFGVYYRHGEPPEGGDADSYLVDHSRMITLFGPQGEPIAIVPHDQGPEGVARELDRWVR
ncbi:SCO family protein [Sphingosinicella sp. CPCC 101087]|uniref:SCO family protein n=1 Tax=Sphingosinicella sp. CPCC 101087 TaxID=2497754 RepID=UPI001FB06B61|nr:SCO family protein [Sphingosinicella sp. CPCC 101087]